MRQRFLPPCTKRLLPDRNRLRWSSPQVIAQPVLDRRWGWPKARRKLGHLLPAPPRRALLTAQRRLQPLTVLQTRIETGYSYPGPFSFVVFVFVASHVVDPSLDSLFAAGERTQNSNIFFKGIDFRVEGTDHGATFLNHKLDAVAGCKPEPSTNLLRNGDLAFAADCTGVPHLYSASLQ